MPGCSLHLLFNDIHRYSWTTWHIDLILNGGTGKKKKRWEFLLLWLVPTDYYSNSLWEWEKHNTSWDNGSSLVPFWSPSCYLWYSREVLKSFAYKANWKFTSTSTSKNATLRTSLVIREVQLCKSKFASGLTVRVCLQYRQWPELRALMELQKQQ